MEEAIRRGSRDDSKTQIQRLRELIAALDRRVPQRSASKRRRLRATPRA